MTAWRTAYRRKIVPSGKPMVKHPHATAEQENEQNVGSIPEVDRASGEGQSAKRGN
jgi:hypothetical protein